MKTGDSPDKMSENEVQSTKDPVASNESIQYCCVIGFLLTRIRLNSVPTGLLHFDIHGPQWMNPASFGDFSSSTGQSFHVS